MYQLRPGIELLRMLATQSHIPSSVIITEIRIDEFVFGGMPGGRVALERLAQAIEAEEAKKRAGENLTIAKEYVHSLLQRLA